MRHVIIGNGIAGISTAETIRKNRDNDEIVMISSEPDVPYWRASLSHYITEVIPLEKMGIKPVDWFRKNNIKQVTGEVLEMQIGQKRILYREGSREESVTFDKLCVSSGADPISLNIPGKGFAEILTFRSIKDSEKLKEMLPKARNIVVIGGGVLGLEVVDLAVKKEITCTVLQRGDQLGTPLVDEAGSEILLKRVRGADGVHKKGATVLFGAEAEEFIGKDGHLKGIRLKSGEEIPCDIAVVCIGISTNSEIFNNSGLKFERGLLVDEHQQASIPEVYGAGDCVVYPNESGRLVPTRTWVTSRIQGKTAGFNMCDIPCLLFDEGPMYNASYMFDMVYSIIGEFNAGGDSYKDYHCYPDRFSYRKVIFKEDRIVGAMMLGNRNGDQAIRRLIAQKVEIPSNIKKEKLLDPAFDPNDLADKGIDYIMY